MDISNFLRSYEVPSDVIKNFTSNGITIDLLYRMTPEVLKELCPLIGTRMKILEIITATASTESNTSENEEAQTQNITCMNETVIDPNKCFPNFDLNTLLQTSVGGNSILQFYKSNSCLNNNKRNQLTDIIIKHIYTYIVNHKISYEEYNLLAAKIVTVFPKESTGIYFVNPIKKRQSITGRPVAARGKLVDKVRNLLYKYGDRKRSLESSENELIVKRTHSEIQESQDLIWLKANRDPWDEVVKRWKNSFDIREETDYNNINEFYIHWPILADPRSYSLISLDFEQRYPNSGLYFYLYFNEFFEKVVELRQPSNETLSLINSLQELDEDSKIPGQIDIINTLIPPKGRLNKKIKFSKQEALDSIFILARNAGDIDNIIEEQKQKAFRIKIPVQPYIILQGTSLQNCSSPLLIIDNVKYSITSISKAFDTLFKTFHVFNARYPLASNHFHLMIQRCVYKIKTKYDNVVPYIADVLELF